MATRKGAKKRTFRLNDEHWARLDHLAAMRFADNQHATLRAALQIAEAVYAVPAARLAMSPLAALQAACETGGIPEPQDMPRKWTSGK